MRITLWPRLWKVPHNKLPLTDSESESQTFTLCTVKKKTASANYIFRETPCLLGIHTRKLSFFLFFLEWSTAAEIRSTEERLLFNLTTQPGLCAPRGDDPYKSVSVYAEAAMIPLLGKFSLKAHVEGSQSKADSGGGGENELTLSLPNLFFGLSCGLWHSGTLQLHSLSLSIWKCSLWIRTANLSSCLRVDVSQSILKSVPRLSLSLSLFISCDARNTHQGAVVQESRGEVAVEAERQDVSFPAANSHFVLWQGWDSSEKTVVCYYSDDLNPQEKEAVTSSEPEAQSQVRSLKWALCHSGVISEWKRGIITVQPGHAGVMNFELFTLQILHGEMGAEQQVRFIFRGNETGVN